jgi:hypothetical protein
MTRRLTLVALAALIVPALTVVACSKAAPVAPTAVSPRSAGTDAAFDTSSSGGATGSTALLRPGAVDVKGVIKGINLEAHTFVLVARNDREVEVQVTQKTVFAAGPNPRVRMNFRMLKPGMPVDVVGKVERGVLVAASVVVLKPRP